MKETGEMSGDCGITMQNIHGSIKPEVSYHISKRFRRKEYEIEAVQKCRDWAFENTPFNILCSYMKEKNTASSVTVMANEKRKADEIADDEGEVTVVYAVTRKQWTLLKEKKAGC